MAVIASNVFKLIVLTFNHLVSKDFFSAINNKGYKLKLTPKNCRWIAQMLRTISMIHQLRVLKAYKTKR